MQPQYAAFAYSSTNDDTLTVDQIARELGAHIETVRAWVRSGEIKGIMLSRRQGYRVKREALDAFVQERIERNRSKLHDQK